MNKPANGFGMRLRWWRERRALSQLDLALEADTSQRHLSFLESGWAAPSREMVLRLGATLGLPLRQQNALLLAAGFAPAWRETPLEAPQLALVQSALDHMLQHHEPYPALVVDRSWNLLRANRGAATLTAFLSAPAPPPEGPVNLADALLSPQGWRPLIENWQEVALYFLRDVQADAFADPSAETEALLARLLAYPDVPSLSRAPLIEEAPLPCCRCISARTAPRYACSPRSRRSGRRGTSRCRASASRRCFRPMSRPARCCGAGAASGRKARPAAAPSRRWWPG